MQEDINQQNRDILEAGTGFMISLYEMVTQLEHKGYTENLGAKGDHFEARSGALKLYPKDFVVDKVLRFENTSDPDDQAIIYAISAPDKGVKGIYVDSYGIYQDSISPELLRALREEIREIH
jgi:hypothetical protein